MNRFRSLAGRFLVAWLLLAPGFAFSRPEPAAASGHYSVWLISNGFHSAVALRVRDAGPELVRLTPARRGGWLVVGWGNGAFYRASRVTPWLCMKATMWPGASVVHVVPIDRPLQMELAHSDIVEFRVGSQKMRALRAYLEESLSRDAAGRLRSFGPGYFRDSRFYAGRERFYLPKTCNVWTAGALRRVGIPVFVPVAVMADPLLWQAQRHGKRIARRSRPVDAF